MGTSGQLCEGCFPKLSLSTRHVGDTYSDLGATITAPAQDKKPRNQNLPQRKTRERYRHRHVAIAHSDCSLSVPFPRNSACSSSGDVLPPLGFAATLLSFFEPLRPNHHHTGADPIAFGRLAPRGSCYNFFQSLGHASRRNRASAFASSRNRLNARQTRSITFSRSLNDARG
jgi:hypothetical protein